jgi:16S rRNA (uracil1498-N3)-methyltransferase
MQIFYVPGITGDRCVMDKNESAHCIRVLRMTKGQAVQLVDGKGNLFEGIIINPDPNSCEINITRITKNFERRGYRLHLAVSPLKNQTRLEWLVEKSVEIGVDEITPLICMLSEKPGVKSDRINNIIISAMKQSLKAYRTILNEPVLFEDFVAKEYNGLKMIAHCNQEYDRVKIDEIYNRKNNAVIMIGPEGDFTPQEVNMAINNGFRSINLGSARLRTETAGIAACHSIYFINQ